MTFQKTSKKQLEGIAHESLYSHGVSKNTILYSYEIFSRWMLDGAILEMGPAEGVMTAHLVERGQPLAAVEGSKKFCEDLQQRYPKAEIVHALFEEFSLEKKFSNIILGHVLEHVDDPVIVLQVAKKHLCAGGRILAAVPNAHSLHRQAAVRMGLLPYESALNELDRHHGHQRVYTMAQLIKDFLQAGCSVVHTGGYWLKPLSNKQIEDHWTAGMLDAFMALGEGYPDIAGEIYIVAQ